MNELKVVARLLAQERGEAVRLTRERCYPLSHHPMVMVPVVMAGASPSLFALGIGDGIGPCHMHGCAEPRNREQQGVLLGHAAADMENFLRLWEANAAVMPQLITASRDASRVCLLTLHRMTYARQPGLRLVGRRLHWLDRAFERPDSAALLTMPSAICELFATGQDEHADTHLGALLEWLKPADGQIYQRVARAEEYPASTATDARLDNAKLISLVDALGEAVRRGNVRFATRLRADIEQIFVDEVERRYQLIGEALRICRSFPGSIAAEHIQHQDRTRYERNLAYVVNPEHLLAARLSGNAATAEFLSRELNAEHLQGLIVRSVSGSRSSARLSGDILLGQVIRRDIRQCRGKTTICYQVRSNQERLAIRRGDKLTLLNERAFRFGVMDLALDASGDTSVTIELTSGKRKSGKPKPGDHVELVQVLSSPARIARSLRLAHDRLLTSPPGKTVTGQKGAAQDYLSGIHKLRSTA